MLCKQCNVIASRLSNAIAASELKYTPSYGKIALSTDTHQYVILTLLNIYLCQYKHTILTDRSGQI